MSEKKLFKITIENIVDEQKYVIEYLANKNMRFPDIAMPNLTGKQKMCLTYVLDGEEQPLEVYDNEKVNSTYIPEEKEKARIQRLPISMPEHKGEVLWVKVRDNIIVDYCAGNYGSADEIPEDVVFESMVLK